MLASGILRLLFEASRTAIHVRDAGSVGMHPSLPQQRPLPHPSRDVRARRPRGWMLLYRPLVVPPPRGDFLRDQPGELRGPVRQGLAPWRRIGRMHGAMGERLRQRA